MSRGIIPHRSMFRLINSHPSKNTITLTIDGYAIPVADPITVDLQSNSVVNFSNAQVLRSLFYGNLGAHLAANWLKIVDGYADFETLIPTDYHRRLAAEMNLINGIPAIPTRSHLERQNVESSPHYVSYAPSGALGSNIDIVADLTAPCRAIRVGVGGDIVLTPVFPGASDITIKNVQSGETLYVMAITIKSTGTTAQQITIFRLTCLS